MKVLVIGLGRHGKDTVAAILKEMFGLSFASSSEFMAKTVVYPVLKDKYGYSSVEECFNDRANHREEWKQLISDYNTPDKSKLSKMILEEYDMYVGMRCGVEFEASKHLFDLIIWVDASERVKYVDPTLTIEYDPNTMYLIDNNGCSKQLKRNIAKLRTKLEYD